MLLIIPLLLTAVSWKSETRASPILSEGPHTFTPMLYRYPRDGLETLNATFFPSTLITQGTSSCTCPQLRSTWNILWSCLVTIFACTWVAVHPNSPGVNPGRWKPALRRLELMIWSLLTPEMVIFWGLRQWVGAREIAREYKDFGWTITHGHFLQMGGFVLSSNDKILEVLTPDRFEELRCSGEVKFPTISADEINALSKGDGLSKTIVLAQTLWFIAQCISRAVQGLVITELELATCAFCFLNGFMYFLWWDKPLDATFVIRLEFVDQDKTIPIPPGRLGYIPNSPKAVYTDVHFEYKPMPASINDAKGNEDIGIDLDNIPYIQQPSTVHVPQSDSRRLSLSSSVNNRVAGERSNHQPAVQPASPESATTTTVKLHKVVMFIWHRLAKMQGSRCKDKGQKMQSPMFGALVGLVEHHAGTYYIHYYLVIALLAMIFGGIHCAGWKFEFPSHAEKIIWRVSSSIIFLIPCIMAMALLPIIYVVCVQSKHKFRLDWWARPGVSFSLRAVRVWGLLVKMFPAIYLLARVVLLVEAFISLRNLSDGAYAQVEWLKFLPHI